MVKEKLAKGRTKKCHCTDYRIDCFSFSLFGCQLVDPVFLSSSKQEICCLNTSKK